MSEYSGFFNSFQGDRRYYISFLAEYFASFIGNGVFFGGNNLKVEPYGGNMDITVNTGKAFINGYYYANKDTAKVITLDTAHLTMARIDTVVLRLNLSESTRAITATVIKGTPSETPVAPSLQRDNAIYDLRLADIRINAAVTEILTSNITDTRLSSECGVVTSKVPSDFTLEEIFNQYTAILNEKTTQWETQKISQTNEFNSQMQSQQAEFEQTQTAINAWFQSVIQDIAMLQTFDFDNLIYLKGYKYKTQTTEGVITETITKVSDSTVYATRTNTKISNGWRVLTVCTEKNVNTTVEYTKQIDGSWEGVIS